MENVLSFTIPFSGFCGTTFINCFSPAYLFLEKYVYDRKVRKQCGTATCDDCGYCREDGRYFFLFDTMCGRSSLRCGFDGKLTEMERLIGEIDPYEGDTDNNIDFLFGFAGYEYRKLTAPNEFKAAIVASIDAGKPVIAKVKSGGGRFRVITGYGGDALICPDYTGAQNKPETAPGYDELEALYIFGDKITPRYMLKEGLERIRQVMEYNANEKLWDGYIEKMGLYTADGLNNCDTEEKKARMKRVAETMWHTFSCHNFAEVFRKYHNSNSAAYDEMGDMKKLRDPKYKGFLDEISACCGYTHDLAWALIGLEECADWNRHAAGYFGEMVELTLGQIAKNDARVLEIIKELIDNLS
jgi:hypothetical protein